MPAHDTYGHPASAACPICGYPNIPETSAFIPYGINHPPELMDQYAGKHVAWSLDGRELLAWADTFADLVDVTLRLDFRGRGIECILDYCHHPDDPGLA